MIQIKSIYLSSYYYNPPEKLDATILVTTNKVRLKVSIPAMWR
jgi:hypothetical protein